MKKKIGLALGSGAARGLSQIGILTWLKEHNIKISYVSGCSIGSLIGGLFAAGYTPEYIKEIVLGVKKYQYLKIFKPSFAGSSLLSREGIEIFLKEILDELLIETLPIPYACVSSDLISGEEVVFKEGNLVTAILASISIPGILPPLNYRGMDLVDGGLVNPVPLDLAFELGADRAIGVNVSKPVLGKRIIALTKKTSVIERVDSLVQAGVKISPKPIAELLERVRLVKNLEKEDAKGRMFYNTMADSLTIFSSRIIALKRMNLKRHFMIEPRVGAYRSFDFDRAEELIEIGYREIESKKDELFRYLRIK